MGEVYGLWPGVVAIEADADLYCVDCAGEEYGRDMIMEVVDAVKGYERYVDREGNSFGVVLRMSEDLHAQYCARCHEPLCNDGDCFCYQASDGAWWEVPLEERW